MSHSFVCYIDESGDDGVGNPRLPGSHGGQTQWLVISACVYRAIFDLESVGWRDEILRMMPNRKGREIHFANMNHSQRKASVQSLAAKPVRLISILLNKTAIDQEIFSERNRLYFYMTRYLIERVSWLCRDYRRKAPEGDGTVKVTFSRRGGLSIPDFQAYLDRLKAANERDVKIHWPVIDLRKIDAQDHSRRAGLQLVDQVASSFAAAVEPDRFGNCETRYAEILKDRVYNNNGNYLSYGVKMVPRQTAPTLSPDQARFVTMFEQKKWQSPGP